MQYQCQTCLHIYDEEKEQNQFNELSDDWNCPACSASKEMFMVI